MISNSFKEIDGVYHLWDSLLRLNQNQISPKVPQNKTKDILRDKQRRNRRVRKIRNKLCSRKCSRLNPARLNKSDIIEFKKKENFNSTTIIDNTKIRKTTQPLFNVHYGKSVRQ